MTGRSYLTEVDSGGHPLQEAALLDQVSSLNASYNYTDPGATEFSTINIGGQFWLPQGFLNLQFVKLEADRFQSEQAYTAEIGHSPSNQSLLAVGIISGDFDTIFTARGKLLLNLQSDNPLNLQVTYSHDSQDPNFEFNMDYYVDRTFSVGAFYDNDDLIGLDVQKFITPDIGIGALMQSRGSVDSFGISSAFRF